MVKCCLGILHCNWDLWGFKYIAWRIRTRKMYRTYVVSRIHCHLCNTNRSIPKWILHTGHENQRVQILFFKRVKLVLSNKLLKQIITFIIAMFRVKIYIYYPTCTHITTCTCIYQTTNLGVHARTVLSEDLQNVEITKCF